MKIACHIWYGYKRYRFENFPLFTTTKWPSTFPSPARTSMWGAALTFDNKLLLSATNNIYQTHKNNFFSTPFPFQSTLWGSFSCCCFWASAGKYFIPTKSPTRLITCQTLKIKKKEQRLSSMLNSHNSTDNIASNPEKSTQFYRGSFDSEQKIWSRRTLQDLRNMMPTSTRFNIWGNVRV